MTDVTRPEDTVREARRVLAEDSPAGHLLWKPWALDLADGVLGLVAERDRAMAALEGVHSGKHLGRQVVELEAERDRLAAIADAAADFVENEVGQVGRLGSRWYALKDALAAHEEFA